MQIMKMKVKMRYFDLEWEVRIELRKGGDVVWGCRGNRVFGYDVVVRFGMGYVTVSLCGFGQRFPKRHKLFYYGKTTQLRFWILHFGVWIWTLILAIGVRFEELRVWFTLIWSFEVKNVYL